MKPSNRVIVALLCLPSVFLAVPDLAAQDPPPCEGGEPYQLIVEVSPDGGSTWYSGSLSYLEGYPGQVIDLPVRTVLTVSSGETQGWSFSLEHDDSELRAYDGYTLLDTVTTSGTHTETVQNGLPPDFDETAVRGSSTGYTQGIIVDNGSTNYTLSPPTGTFVTSGACYSFAFPPTETYGMKVTFRLTHELGTPPIDTVVSQEGQSMVPCVKDLSVYVAASYSYWSSSSCPTDWTTGSQMSGASSSSTTLEPAMEEVEPAGVGPAGGGGPEGGECPVFEPYAMFRRGDSNADESFDISDVTFTLGYLFQGGQAPGCDSAADANGDEKINITDPIFTLSWLFRGSAPPPPPHEECGVEDMIGELGCASYPPCTIDGPNITQKVNHQSETAVAINPCNPQNVVVLANDFFLGSANDVVIFRAVSWDGGATWPVRGVVFGEGSRAADPSLAFDRFGNLYAAYLGADGILHVAVSTDGGVTLADSQVTIDGNEVVGDQPTIVTGPAFDETPETAGDEGEAVWVTLATGDQEVSALGATVSGPLSSAPEFTLFPVAECSCGFGDIAVGTNGEVVVTYEDQVTIAELSVCPTRIFVHRREGAPTNDQNETFGSQLEVAQSQVCDGILGSENYPAGAGILTAPVLDWDRTSGRLYLAFLDEVTGTTDTNVMLLFSNDGGSTWGPSPPILVTPNEKTQFHQDVAVDPTTGSLALSWYDAREDPNNEKISYYATYGSVIPVGDAEDLVTNFKVGFCDADAEGELVQQPLGDYTSISFHSGAFVPAWSENSQDATCEHQSYDEFSDVFTRRIVPE